MEGIQAAYDSIVATSGKAPTKWYVNPREYNRIIGELSECNRFTPANFPDGGRICLNGLDIIADRDVHFKRKYLGDFVVPKHPDGTPKRNYCREMLDKYMKDQERHMLDSMVYGQSAFKAVWDENKVGFNYKNIWPPDW